MESRISPLQDDALNVLERPSVHVPRTLIMISLHSGENFRKKKYCEKLIDLIRYHSKTNKRYLSDFFFCSCLLRLSLARLASLDAGNID